jgi:hypothetical protein
MCAPRKSSLLPQAGLHAEAAADVADHDAKILGLALEYIRQQLSRAGWRLVLRVQGGSPALDDADGTAWLDRIDDQALVEQFKLGDMRRPGKCLVSRLRITHPLLGRNIAIGAGKQLHCARLNRLFCVHHGRQFLVGNRHQLCRILGLHARLRDHGNHRLAGVIHRAVRQWKARRHDHGRAIGALEYHRYRNESDAIGLQVIHAPHGEHARCRPRRSQIRRRDACMRVRRANHHKRGFIHELAVITKPAPTSRRSSSRRF